MSLIVYKFLAHLFYYIGDALSRLPWFPYTLYSCSMKLSLDFDEKCGYNIWKEPPKF